MSYLDIGFSENLSVAEIGQQNQQFDPLQIEQMIPEISGAKLSGLVRSQDGRLQMDLDNNSFIVTDGVIERVRLGQQSDGTYGLLIKDNDGNDLMSIGEKNIIQSANKNFVIDIGNEQFIVYENGLPRIILGRFPGLF